MQPSDPGSPPEDRQDDASTPDGTVAPEDRQDEESSLDDAAPSEAAPDDDGGDTADTAGAPEISREEATAAADAAAAGTSAVPGETAGEEKAAADDGSDEEAVAMDALGLSDALVTAVGALGFETATPIQAAAIPPMLTGANIIGRARTGSGKTAAFGLPLLHRIEPGNHGVQALVLAPTRELAIQVSTAVKDFAAHMPVRIATIYGGAPYPPQLRALAKGASVVVGTPGRVIDLIEKGALDLSRLRLMVLDEADEMLRMGFIEDVETILAQTPDDRQVALFSATMPAEIRRVVKAYVPEHVVVQVERSGLTVDHIDQRWLYVPHSHKLEALQRLLAAECHGTTLVFVRTRLDCGRLADELARRGVNADALHGDLNQRARERILDRLRAKSVDVLIATDVAARGIDVNHITHVINFDMPGDLEHYVHRIGRTGRAGRSGTALSFVTPRELGRLRFFAKSLGIRMEQGQMPSDADIARSRTGHLVGRLEKALEAEDASSLRRWVEERAAEHDWSPLDVAAAALALLTEGKELLDEADASPHAPRWSVMPERERRRHEARRDRPARGGPAGSRGGGARRQNTNEVELFVAIGSQRGIRPSDIVGSLANEFGVPARAIGRITIRERRSFVGMPREIGEQLLQRTQSIKIRGMDVRIAPSRGPSGGSRQGG